MTTTGNVQVAVVDGGGGNVSLPQSSVQAVIGCATGGPVATIVSTRSPATMASYFTSGELPEYGALAAQAGGVMLLLRAQTVTAGAVNGQSNAPVSIASSTNATPIEVTTSAPHLLITGDVATIAGHLVNTAANGTWIVVVDSSTTFHLVGSVGIGVATGAVQFDGVVQSSTASVPGTSVVTVTGTPVDTYYVQIDILLGGTIGTGPIQFRWSLDAGRQFAAPVNLGTATSWAIPGTGLTANFAAGTLAGTSANACDTIRFSTVGPQTNDAGIAQCLAALQASGYAATGWGSTVILGALTGTDATTIESGSPGLDQLAAGYVFQLGKIAVRDAKAPQKWGGPGETEAAWMSAIETAMNVSAWRVQACVGHYNMPTAFPIGGVGWRYRRPGGWAEGARQVAILPQDHSGEVDAGALSQIVTDLVNDPADGFVYHDERINPGLDAQQGGAARLTSFRTRVTGPGWYVCNPLTLAPPGSDFAFAYDVLVMNDACDLVVKLGTQLINKHKRANKDGTLFATDLAKIQGGIKNGIDLALTAIGEISGVTVYIDPAQNVRSLKKVAVSVTVNELVYILELDAAVGYQNATAAS